jgi:hypothetical protein
VASVSHLAPIHLGLDVHKDTISVGILDPDHQVPDVERITNDEPSIRRLVPGSPSPARCEPATRPAPPASSWPGCCTAWTCAAR